MLYIYDEKDPEHLAAMNRFGMYAGGDGWLTITSMTLEGAGLDRVDEV
jgi:hypothetical protein